MELLTSVNLHRFPETVLAEVVEEGQDGEISIRSHELEIVDEEERVLRPRSKLPPTDAMLIDECADADGLTVEIEATVTPNRGT